MAKKSNNGAPSVLAFERKLDCSDGLFSAGQWKDKDADSWPALELREKAVRGTMSHRLSDNPKDVAKLETDAAKPNPQTIDIASLPDATDTLRLRFTLKILPGVGKPSACNSPDFQVKLDQVIKKYRESNGFKVLASRYANNLANGRFLWRNRLGAEKIEVKVRQLKNGTAEQPWTFNALDFDLKNFSDAAQVQELGALIQRGLQGEEFVLLEVVAHARMGQGQEVYPSQELVTERIKGKKNKVLYSVGKAAAMHSQKIGNALRTIDDWYPVSAGEQAMGPISVEPYGSVTSMGKVFRAPRNHDFYSLLDSWILKDKLPSIEDQHFVMATFVRGGVFGGGKAEKNA